MSTLNLVVAVRAEVRRRRAVLRLSPLLRYALSTAKPDPSGRPNLLPERVPHACAHNLFRCRAIVKWIVGDGQNCVFMCDGHYDALWEAGNDTKDYTVERVKAGKYRM